MTTATVNDSAELVRSLLQPDAYPHPVRGLHLRETHVSYLFFTGDTVYKVKKPVDLGFLDFTTLERRRHFCRREVELNRRISPEVYLGVVPITRRGGCFHVQGRGRPVEYAVAMKQLPEERALRALLGQGRVSRARIESIAEVVADFHRRAPTSPRITRLGDLATVSGNVEENFEQTRKYVGLCITGDCFDDLEAYSRAFLRVHAGEFRRREAAGRVRDGHGDLHADNVFLSGGVQIIDCIEFNERFRCLDVAEEIAFLAMDLDFHGRPDLSEAFVSRYLEASGDEGVLRLLDFFKVYRACVKGKVAAFRLDQLDPAEAVYEETLAAAQAYFRLAHSYVPGVLQAPACYCFMGLMGTGKTVLSQELARRWKLRYLSSDVTRKQLTGVPLEEHQYEAYGRGIYSPQQTEQTYRRLAEFAALQLEAGASVVLDASFSKRRYRELIVQAAEARGVRPVFIECSVSLTEIARRLEDRLRRPDQSVSDGRWELYRQQAADWEDVSTEEESRTERLDTGAHVPRTIAELLERLFDRALRRRLPG